MVHKVIENHCHLESNGVARLPPILILPNGEKKVAISESSKHSVEKLNNHAKVSNIQSLMLVTTRKKCAKSIKLKTMAARRSKKGGQNTLCLISFLISKRSHAGGFLARAFFAFNALAAL